jgi:flagellar protein FlaG
MTTELSSVMVAGLQRSSPSVRQDATAQVASSNPVPVPKAEVEKQQPVQQQMPAESGQELEETVEELNQMVQSVRRNLQFSIDKESGRTVIKVIDSDSEEVIRQIPPEEVLALARRLVDMVEEPGVIIQETV